MTIASEFVENRFAIRFDGRPRRLNVNAKPAYQG